MMANFTEIFLAQPEQSRAEKFGVAAHVIVCVRVQVFAILVAPDFFRVVFALLVDGLGAPIVLFARHVRAALNEQNPLATRGEPMCQRAAARAGADDDDVEVIVHDEDWSGWGGKPYK